MFQQKAIQPDATNLQTMTQQSIIKILADHGVRTKIEAGVLMACEDYSLNGIALEEWVNASNWDKADLLAFLNYDLVD